MKHWLQLFLGAPAIVLLLWGVGLVAGALWDFNRAIALVVAWALFSAFVTFMSDSVGGDDMGPM